MPINSRTKGAVAEREVAKLLTDAGYPSRRGQQFSGSPDSPDVKHSLPLPIHIEVKRVEALSIYPAMEQAMRDSAPGEMPTVWHRRSKKPWLVVMLAEDFLKLVPNPLEDILS